MGAYVEALTEFDSDSASLFLAGGISGCADWQSVVAAALADLPVAILNPRRRHFPMADRSAAEQQIVWEHRHLRLASAIAFWFPPDTLCPITLFELGAWSMTSKPSFVGTHIDYQRRQDVVVQMQLARPEVPVTDSLEELQRQIRQAYALR